MPSIKRNFAHNFIFLLSNILFPLISFSYASRILGPEAYGKIQFVLVFAQYFVLVAAMGIPIFGVREIAKVRHDKNLLSNKVSELLIINIISSALLMIVYIIVIISIGWFKEDFQLYLLGGLIVLTGFSTLDWFYNGVEQFHFLSIRSIVIKSLSLIALFLFVKTKGDFILYFIVVLFSILANNFWNLVKLRGHLTFKLANLNFRSHLPVLLTLLGTTLSISIYTVIDTLLLGFLADNTSVGYYTAALKISKIAIPIVTVLGVVLIPKITQSIANNDIPTLNKLANYSFSFICLIGIPIAAGLFLFASEFIISISGTEFSSAILTMKITAPIALLVGFGHLFGFQLLIPAGLEKKYLIATICGMVISIILNLILINGLKDKGTAIATLSGELVVSFIAFYYVYKKMNLSINWWAALQALIACIIFIPLAYLLRQYINDAIIRLIIAIPISAILYFFTQAFIFKNPLIKEGLVMIQNKLGVNSRL